MRTDQERSQIFSLIASPQWETIRQVAEEFCVKAKTETSSASTEWEFIQACLIAEGKAQGVRQFLQELGKEANYKINE